MTQEEAKSAATPSSEKQAFEKAVFFNTATLARFVRVCYGPDALKEAQRHVAAYNARANFELAKIWERVLAHLQGVETKEDHRRIVKSAKSLRLKE